MDIGSKNPFPAGNLSNFTAHPFTFDGVECSSMEGLLQALKYDNAEVQIEICKLVGIHAQRRGQERNNAWKSVRKLWWQGKEIDRHGAEYQTLLTRAYNALSTNSLFRDALLATGEEQLTHSIGKSNPEDTILTEREFCDQLVRIRNHLRSDESPTVA